MSGFNTPGLPSIGAVLGGNSITAAVAAAAAASGYIAVDTENTQGIAPETVGLSCDFIGSVREVQTPTFAAAMTPDFTTGSVFEVTLTGNLTITQSANMVAGQQFTMILKQDATGSRTGTFPSNWKFVGGSKTLSTAASAIDTITGVYDGTNAWCSLLKAYA